VAEPFAGGLESHTVWTARALMRQGHDVTVFAGPASEPVPSDIDVVSIIDESPDFSGVKRRDTQMSRQSEAAVTSGYERVLGAIADSRFDVVHNNSLHFIPVLHDGGFPVPMVHVVHCPPFDELETAHRSRRARFTADALGDVIAVSESLASQWRDLTTAVVPNGIPVADFSPESLVRAGEHCVWAGRMVEEKAPHLAIDAARLAGRHIVLAGPVQHQDYFDRMVAPRLGPDAQYLGHLDHRALRSIYSTAAVGLITPQWDEPFGLVVAEMLAAGTPVAAFDRGALRSVAPESVAAYATSNDASALAVAVDDAATRDRSACRSHARRHLSDEAMAQRYVGLYLRAIERQNLQPTDQHRRPA